MTSNIMTSNMRDLEHQTEKFLWPWLRTSTAFFQSYLVTRSRSDFMYWFWCSKWSRNVERVAAEESLRVRTQMTSNSEAHVRQNRTLLMFELIFSLFNISPAASTYRNGSMVVMILLECIRRQKEYSFEGKVSLSVICLLALKGQAHCVPLANLMDATC